MDAGDIWASVNFPMRAASKRSLYRNEVTEAATRALLQAVERFEKGSFVAEPLDYSRPDVRGKRRPYMTQAMRAIDWWRDDTTTVMRKIRSGDTSPGVLDSLSGKHYYLYNAYEEDTLRGIPGTIIAQRYGAICRATVDGAVWITHMKEMARHKTFKLPAATLLGDKLQNVPETCLPLQLPSDRSTYSDIWYEEKNQVGYLHFDFYNGAMGTEQCLRLKQALMDIRERKTRVIVLMGGADFWSNGLDLNAIEGADSPANESWQNINAMNELARTIIATDTRLTVSALQGNAGAGGAFLALAADRVYAREGVILNPHYKSMGNLYGSEYWTYLLPKRVGRKRARAITENRLPIGVQTAKQMGFVDDVFGGHSDNFRHQIDEVAEQLAGNANYGRLMREKILRRSQDENNKALEQYRIEELERMKLSFYGFDPSYHVARYNFVYKVPHSWTPLHLARHRRKTRHNSHSDTLSVP